VQLDFGLGHDPFVRQDERPLNCVFEFANIAGPMVFIKYRERLGSDGTLPSAPIQEMLDERGNILASWRQLNRDDIQPVVEVLSKLSFLDGCSKFREVAAISRMSTGMGVLLPNRSTVRSWIARSSFDWSAGANSAISSKNRVPPFASSNRPIRQKAALVKAPFSCPNSSLLFTVAGSHFEDFP
jgi:hypothetical protein